GGGRVWRGARRWGSLWGWPSPRAPPPMAEAHSSPPGGDAWALVAGVVDGDTIVVEFDNGATARVSYIGLAAPAAADAGQPAQCFDRGAVPLQPDDSSVDQLSDESSGWSGTSQIGRAHV